MLMNQILQALGGGGNANTMGGGQQESILEAPLSTMEEFMEFEHRLLEVQFRTHLVCILYKCLQYMYLV